MLHDFIYELQNIIDLREFTFIIYFTRLTVCDHYLMPIDGHV